jgi:hypothetical protein
VKGEILLGKPKCIRGDNNRVNLNIGLISTDLG